MPESPERKGVSITADIDVTDVVSEKPQNLPGSVFMALAMRAKHRACDCLGEGFTFSGSLEPGPVRLGLLLYDFSGRPLPAGVVDVSIEVLVQAALNDQLGPVHGAATALVKDLVVST